MIPLDQLGQKFSNVSLADKNSFLSEISSAVPGMPQTVYFAISSYAGMHPHELQVRDYFLENCYKFEDWEPRQKAFTEFVNEKHIDVNNVCSLDLSGLNCESDGIEWGIIPERCSRGCSVADLSLTFLFSVLPNLREVKASNAPGFASSVASIQLTDEEKKRSQVKTLDLTCTGDFKNPLLASMNFKDLYLSLSQFPQLRQLVITGGSVSEELKNNFRKLKPEIELID